MLVNNTELVYFIDYLGKRIHILDLNFPGRTKIANAIDPIFQQKVIDEGQLLKDILDFEWFIYAHDGIIGNYKEYNFRLVNPRMPYLHKPYLDEMLQRRNNK
jgi:hypothetical protein